MKMLTINHPLPRAVLLSWVLCVGTTHAGERAAQSQLALGERVYDAWCVTCHGPGPGRDGRGLTGTEALEAKYDGKLPPVLDERQDLTPGFVAAMVRHGVSVMPFFRRTEISDAELAALGAYLARLNPASHPQPTGRL